MIIIKIGGGDAMNLEGIAFNLSQLREKYIVVHGANALRDSLAQQLNKPRKTVTSVSGYTSVLSDAQTIDLQMMAYAGLRNKRIVEFFRREGINAVGLCGLDGGVIRGKRNPGIRVNEKGKLKMLRDLSGKPTEINKPFLDLLLQNGFAPVLTVPIMDENRTAINSENDDIVALIQREYRAEKVIHLIEAPGFLKDPTDENSCIPLLTLSQLNQWEAGAEGRIKRKLHAIKRLFEIEENEENERNVGNGVNDGNSGNGGNGGNGINRENGRNGENGKNDKSHGPLVFIADGRVQHPVIDALEGKGTVVIR